MKKVGLVAVVIVIALVAICTSYFFISSANSNSAPVKKIVGNVVNQQLMIDENNFYMFLEKTNIVKDLPESGVLRLRLFKDINGERIFDDYTIKKGDVVKGAPENPDVTILIDSKYTKQLVNFCETIKTANKNRDLGYETHISSAKLLWKYKGMMKYKECLGN